MVFSSLLFVFAFLPLNLALYSIMKSTPTRNALLLVFSLVFYAWGEPKYVFLLVGMSLADWVISLFVEKYRGTPKAKAALVAACAVSLGLIGIFKYGNFVVENFSSITGADIASPGIMLPIGISFYTFQLLSYVVDVYSGDTPAEKNFLYLLMYASLFHQCIAGPIVRYSDVAREIRQRSTNLDQISRGVVRFSIGLAKKALLANYCGSLTDTLLLSDAVASDPTALAENLAVIGNRPALALWLGVLCFMLQIYLDFSAYSDMAIGMGQMIGFHYKENFDYPYVSCSVTEFWRRWHISLGSFFRDYVYIPLGGNRKGSGRTIFNLLIVWFLTGLWHGASWNYVLWGLYFFVFIALEKLFLGKIINKLPKPISRLGLLIVVYFGWVLFRFKELPLVAAVVKGMFCLNANPFSGYEAGLMLKSNIFFLIVAVLACTPISKIVSALLGEISRDGRRQEIFCNILRAVYPTALLLLSTMSLVGNSYNPFLYFQF